MKLVGIDVGKNSHHFCVMDKETGEFNVTPSSFSNNKEGFDFLINCYEVTFVKTKLHSYSKNIQFQIDDIEELLNKSIDS